MVLRLLYSFQIIFCLNWQYICALTLISYTWHFIFFLKIAYLFSILSRRGLAMWISALCACMVPPQTRKGHCSPWNWSNRKLWTNLYILMINPRRSGRTSTLKTIIHLFNPRNIFFLQDTVLFCSLHWKDLAIYQSQSFQGRDCRNRRLHSGDCGLLICVQLASTWVSASNRS